MFMSSQIQRYHIVAARIAFGINSDSSTKVDFSWRVIRLSGNSTPGGQSVTSKGAGRSPAEAIIWLLFGDVCDQAVKNRHMAVRKPQFGFTLKPRFSDPVLKPLKALKIINWVCCDECDRWYHMCCVHLATVPDIYCGLCN